MRLFFRFFFFVLLMFSWGIIYAQKQGQAHVDSMLQELPRQKEDTDKVKLLQDISYSYCTINPDQGLIYGQQALTLATKLNWRRGISYAYNSLGNNYQKKSDHAKALECFLNALKIFEEMQDKRLIAIAYGNIGLVYQNKSDYDKALDYDLKALKIDEEIGFKRGMATVSGNIGIVYKNQKNYTKALEYYLKALNINKETNNKGGVANVTGNIGVLYMNEKDYIKALAYDFQSLKIYKELGTKYGIVLNTANIGLVYLSMADDTETKQYTKSINASQVTDTNTAKSQLSEADLPADSIPNSKTGCLNKAIDYLEQALIMSKALDAVELLRSCYMDLTRSYKLKGEYEKSAEYNEYYYAIKDSIFLKDNDKKIVLLEAKVDFAREEDSLKLEDEKKQLTMQKELQLNALKYEYEKKQTAAKSEKEKQQLAYEEELKRNKINFDFEQKRLSMEAEQKRAALIETEKQQKKDSETALKFQRQRTYIYIVLGGILLLAGFSFFIVKERRKSENLLLNILPSEVAAELKAKGASEAKLFSDVTVVFTDFVSFTKVSERLSPQELVNELHNCFKTFDEITGRYGIEKIKTMGDAYMAVCGLPLSNPKHAENIVSAAIEMAAFMLGRHTKMGDKTFEIRIGIHSGSVVAGIVGIKKFAYDIWADTVNTAARMEQNGQPGKINISESTYELVKEKFDCEYRGEIEAKNKGMLKMYFVNGNKKIITS